MSSILRIMMMSGPDDGQEINLQTDEKKSEDIYSQFSIGRRETCDLCIPFDTSVSRLHAWLQIRSDGLWLVDDDSRNGTYVNRRRIKEPSPLEVGELFRVGNTWLRVQAFREG